MNENPVNPRTSAQHAAQYPAQYEVDVDGPIDWSIDVPIPFAVSLDHERGLPLDDVDPRGMVP